MKIIIAIGAGILAQATGLLGVVFVRVPRAVWKSAAKDINAAGASMILHSTIATASVIFLIAGTHAKKRAGIIKSVELSDELTWGPETSDTAKRRFLQLLMKDSLPSWVSFPDWEKAPFLQALLRALWPGINKSVSDLLRTNLQNNLPQFLFRKISIAKLDFGSKPITVYGMKMIPTYNKFEAGKMDGLVALIDLRWAGEPDVELRYMGASVKMRTLVFIGQFRVEMHDLMQEAPFMRKLTLSLVNCPKAKLDFSLIPLGTLTNNADLMAGLNVMTPKLKKALHNLMLNKITYPEAINIPLPGGAEEEAEELATPLGVLTVEVHEGELAPRQGKFGWSKRINPRINLVLPAAPPPPKGEPKTAVHLAAMQGAFTNVGVLGPAAKETTDASSNSGSSTTGSTLMEGDHPATWNNESFSFVVTSRTQVLHLVLSHTQSPGDTTKPMGFDKPLGRKSIRLDKLLGSVLPPVEEECSDDVFFTPPDTPRRALEVEDSACIDDLQCLPKEILQGDAVSTAAPNAAVSELEDLPAHDLGCSWIGMELTNATSLATLLKEIIPEDAASLGGVDKQDSEESNAPEGWFNAPNLGNLMGTKIDEVIDDLDWMPIRRAVSGSVRVSFNWQPLRPATKKPKKEVEEIDDKETSECKGNEEKVAAPSPSKTISKTLSNTASSMSESGANTIVDPLEPPLIVRCPCCSQPATLCGTANRIPDIIHLIAREEKLRRGVTVSGVIAVLVERTKLHYGKVPAVPTLAVSLTRPVSYKGGSGELPPALVSQRCKRRHHHGMLAWNQTFYLPVTVTVGELEDEVLKLRIDLGDVKFGMLGAGRWRQYRCGSAVSTLDMYDSYEDDVNVVACSEVPLKHLINRGWASKEKLVMVQLLQSVAATTSDEDEDEEKDRTKPRRSDKVVSTTSIGSMRVQMGWFKP